MSLFWRIYLLNALVVLGAAATLLLGPVTVSTPAVFTEIVVLVTGLVILLILDGLLFRLGLAPVRRLSRAMTSVDLLRPGPRLTVTDRGEIGNLIRTFNGMLDRLETERSRSAARALSAQEGERRRIAQELHDEVGQTLTAVLLDLKRVADRAPATVREELREVQETTRGSLDEIRRIARRLRPGVLTELGLRSAVKVLAGDVAARSGLRLQYVCCADLPDLGEEAELVVYRVAQEALTNVSRHAMAEQVDVSIQRTDRGIELRVRDDGVGVGDAAEGAGVQGMRERALLVDGRFTVGSAPGGRGTEIVLEVPAREERR